MRLTVLLVSLLTGVAILTLGLAALLQPPRPQGPPVAPASERIDTPILPGENQRIDDFEVRAVSAETWHAIALDGRTRSDFMLADGGATAGSLSHLAVDVVRPEEPEPYDVAGVVARLAEGRGRDVSQLSGLTFWFDASPGLYIVQIGSARVSDHDHFNAYVEVREEGWRAITLPFTSFRQEGFGAAVPWSGRDLVHIGFFAVNPGSSRLAIDDLRFQEL